MTLNKNVLKVRVYIVIPKEAFDNEIRADLMLQTHVECGLWYLSVAL